MKAKFGDLFEEGEQEDACDLLNAMFVRLENELDTPKIEDKEKALSRKFFTWQISKEINCPNCKDSIKSIENIHALSLTVPHSNCSLKECIDGFLSESEIEDFACEKCSKKVNAISTQKISNLPKVLAIHFKKAYYDAHGLIQLDKKVVNFPEFLSEEVLTREKDCKFLNFNKNL